MPGKQTRKWRLGAKSEIINYFKYYRINRDKFIQEDELCCM